MDKMKKGPKQWWIQDFPKEDVPTPEGCSNLLFCKNVAENREKMQEIVTRRAESNSPVGSANVKSEIFLSLYL